MPNRDPDEPQDPLAEDDDIVGVADDEDDDLEDVDDEEEDLEDDALSHAEFTAEVGSEGGSPGEAVEVARRRGAERVDPHGSEATETWRPAETTEATEPDIIDRRDPRDRGLMKDTPN